MIPAWQSDGFLPPGVHLAESWQEMEDRFATTPHRRGLLEGLYRALINLRDAGCQRAYINGSFVTEKNVPNDFDACWDPTGVDPARLDPVLLDFDHGRAAQKAKYGGELFPDLLEGSSGLPFQNFFQVDSTTGSPKGIVAIDLGGL